MENLPVFIARRPVLHRAIVSSQGARIEATEFIRMSGGALVAIDSWFQNGKLVKVDAPRSVTNFEYAPGDVVSIDGDRFILSARYGKRWMARNADTGTQAWIGCDELL